MHSPMSTSDVVNKDTMPVSNDTALAALAQRACDYNRHTCRGCGDSLDHGQVVCEKCKALLNA